MDSTHTQTESDHQHFLKYAIMLAKPGPSHPYIHSTTVLCDALWHCHPYIFTSKLKILQIIMWNIGMAQKAKETRSGCLVHIVQ